MIAGLHEGATAAHVARAALDSIAWRVADIVDAAQTAVPVSGLRVDGGLTRIPALLQLQADALGVPVTVGEADATMRGAAMLAGVGAGLYSSPADAATRLPAGRVVRPTLSDADRAAQRARWRSFVPRAAALGV